MNRDIKILITFAVIMITTIISIVFQWKVFLFLVVNDIPILNPIVEGLSPWIIPRMYSFLFTGLFIIFPSYLITKKYIWFEEKIGFENFKFIKFRAIKLTKLPKISMPKISKSDFLDLLKVLLKLLLVPFLILLGLDWFYPTKYDICQRLYNGRYTEKQALAKWKLRGGRYGSGSGLIGTCRYKGYLK